MSLVLALGTYYIIADKEVLAKVTAELTEAMPDPSTKCSVTNLEKLAYFNACIFETLRISYGVGHRLQRICPDQDLKYKDIIIPAGTPVSMTSILIHNDPILFPDPKSFMPERWLPLETKGVRLQKYMVAFSRGSRQCLGMHLARAELYLGISNVIRKFGSKLRVVDTDYERDVALTRDIFSPAARKDSKGIFVMVNDT